MLIGIDVGGTYTDGAVVNEAGEVLAVAKYPTDKKFLLASLLGCLDRVMQGINPNSISRVAISTTLLTNAIIENTLDPTALIVIPGPGLNVANQGYGVKPHVISGAVDFRGKEILPLDLQQVESLCARLFDGQTLAAAVCGKFSPRNNCQELAVCSIIKNIHPEITVELGHQHYGALNFPRRANTTYLTAATRRFFREFISQVTEAVKLRGIKAPVVILKADGGTLPWESAYRLPVETVYSGPAASLLGVMALVQDLDTACIVDIGGTSTDLGLFLSGSPLYSGKGAEIGRYKTLVRSFAVNSVAVGGDSPLNIDGNNILLGERRQGPAYCLGGRLPTPTDAMRFLGLVEHGSRELARQAMEQLAERLGISTEDTANKVIDLVIDKLQTAINVMVGKWQNEPAYRVWQVLNSRKISKFKVIGVGGGAGGIVPRLAERLDTDWELPAKGIVANAIGAALATPTFSCSLRVDTERRTYSVLETGTQGIWNNGLGSLAEAKQLLQKHYAEIARDMGVTEDTGQITREEVFNVVRGYYTEGKIIEVAMERQAGVLNRVGGR